MPTVDIQTSFHSFLLLLVHLKLESKWTQGREVASFHSFLLLLVHLKLESKWTQGREVALIQSTNCADCHSKHLRVFHSGRPPLVAGFKGVGFSDSKWERFGSVASDEEEGCGCKVALILGN